MRVPPFYSPLRGIGLADAWHDDDECAIGRSIAPADRIAGTNPEAPRCRFCALLDGALRWAPPRAPTLLILLGREDADLS